MELKVIKPVDSTAKSAAISKYSPDHREGENSGRRQQSSNSYRPKTEKEEWSDFDTFFASTAKKPVSELSDFELLFRKTWEDNHRMQESAKALEQTVAVTENPFAMETAWIWSMRGNYRPVKK